MTRPDADKVRLAACVGAGTIGGGWAAYFLAHGIDVIASDPGADAEAKLRDLVDRAWPYIKPAGSSDKAPQERLRFVGTVEETVAEADFIQENAPDRKDLKVDLFARIDAACRPDVVIASSSSQFIPTDIAARCTRPERVVVGHPFAPSYLIPLVEVVGGEKTSEETMDWAVQFYDAIGKKTLRLKKEIDYYIANRLQFAVFREIDFLVSEGICDYADADAAIRYGPGRRWAFAGPLICQHMGGGQGGLKGFIEHFGWKGPEGGDKLALRDIERIFGDTSMSEVEAWRDENLKRLDENLEDVPERS